MSRNANLWFILDGDAARILYGQKSEFHGKKVSNSICCSVVKKSVSIEILR